MQVVRFLLSAAALMLLAVNVTPARADVLLVIDISDLSAVIITASGSPSDLDDSSSTLEQGVILQDIFQSGILFDGGSTADEDLRPGDSSAGFDSFSNNWGNLTQLDLNIYGLGGAGVSYSTQTAAFFGSTVLNLTGADFALGSSGDILVGDSVNGSGATIGQWVVVPEPGHLAGAMALGVLLVILARRLYRKNG